MWLYRNPQATERLVATLPTLAAIAVGLKVILAAGLTPKMSRRCGVPPRVLAIAAAAWLMVAGGLIALLVQVFPRERAALLGVAAVVVIFMPLNRLIAAPLILAWNRHR
jgi:hypothetical protein